MPNNIDEAKKNGWEKIHPPTPTSETQEKTGIGSALTEMKALNMISFFTERFPGMLYKALPEESGWSVWMKVPA